MTSTLRRPGLGLFIGAAGGGVWPVEYQSLQDRVKSWSVRYGRPVRSRASKFGTAVGEVVFDNSDGLFDLSGPIGAAALRQLHDVEVCAQWGAHGLQLLWQGEGGEVETSGDVREPTATMRLYGKLTPFPLDREVSLRPAAADAATTTALRKWFYGRFPEFRPSDERAVVEEVDLGVVEFDGKIGDFLDDLALMSRGVAVETWDGGALLTSPDGQSLRAPGAAGTWAARSLLAVSAEVRPLVDDVRNLTALSWIDADGMRMAGAQAFDIDSVRSYGQSVLALPPWFRSTNADAATAASMIHRWLDAREYVRLSVVRAFEDADEGVRFDGVRTGDAVDVRIDDGLQGRYLVIGAAYQGRAPTEGVDVKILDLLRVGEYRDGASYAGGAAGTWVMGLGALGHTTRLAAA